MSIKILNEAWEIRGLDPTAKLVLMCLADMSNEDDRSCWPSIHTVARKCDVTARTVQRHIRALEDKGYIAHTARSGSSSIYYVLPNGDERTGTATASSENKGGRKIVTPDTCDTGANLTPLTPASGGYDTGVRGGTTPASPKPSINHQEPSVPSLRSGTSNPREPVVTTSMTKQSKFDEFWSRYPKRVGKGDAKKAFERAIKRATFDAIMEGLDRYVAKTDDRPWCNPSTWLNQDRWEDEPYTDPVRGSRRRQTSLDLVDQYINGGR